jgi:hypothetical protein
MNNVEGTEKGIHLHRYEGEFQHVLPNLFVGTFNKNTYGSIYEARFTLRRAPPGNT